MNGIFRQLVYEETSVTTHKSQGQTLKNVVIDLNTRFYWWNQVNHKRVKWKDSSGFSLSNCKYIIFC